MSQIERSMLFFAIFLIVCGVSNATVYKVGDSNGWTSIKHVDYKAWAASKYFQVGDTIVFEYKKEFHNVVRVTHANYNLCNSTGSYGTWNSGNDSFTIPKTGHYFFICGFPNHCQGGQRVDIRVPGAPSPKAAPSPSPKALPPHVAPKSSPTTAPPPKVAPIATPPPKASSPTVAPIATPPTPKASSPIAPPTSSVSPPAVPTPQSPAYEPVIKSPAPSPTSSATSFWTSKNLFFVAAIVLIICF